MFCTQSSNTATGGCRERDLSQGWRMSRVCVKYRIPNSEHLENLIFVTRNKPVYIFAPHAFTPYKVPSDTVILFLLVYRLIGHISHAMSHFYSKESGTPSPSKSISLAPISTVFNVRLLIRAASDCFKRYALISLACFTCTRVSSGLVISPV